MPTIYLHVGPHKTGSSYLQNLFSSQSRSLEKQGILYPSIGRNGWTGHHNIAWLFADAHLRNTTYGKLSKGISQLASEKRDILLSSEVFSTLKESQLIKLRDAFPDQNFHVLYFLRKGSAFIVSLWRESVKNGLSKPLDQAHRNFMAQRHGYDPSEYKDNIARFEHCLNSAVSIFDYNKLMEAKTDLTKPVSETIHANIKSKHKQINPSLSAEITELIRAANLFSWQTGNHHYGRSRIICALVLQIPFLGSLLRHHVDQNFIRLRQSMHVKNFLELGYQPAHLLNNELDVSYDYIPGSTMLNELDKDNILPWRIIKKMLQNNTIRRQNG